jgi:hypothetical protein
MNKLFIMEHLLTKSGKLNPRRCREDWFINNNHEDELHQLSKFDWCNSIGEQIYCVLNDIKSKPTCIDCASDVTFKSKVGYSNRCMTCSSKHNQKNTTKPDVVKKKNTSLKKRYEHFDWSDRNEKSKNTYMKNYGVSHFMKLESYQKKHSEIQKKPLNQQYLRNNQFTLNEVVSKTGLSPSHIRNEFHKNGVNWITTKSKYEDELFEFVSKFDVEVVLSDRKILDGLELDFYFPEYNLAIEFNGLYYHSDKFKDKKYHLKKSELCEELGITLLHIFEHEWLEKKDICKSIISTKLQKNHRIYARKTVAKEITNKQAKLFCEENHLKGGINSSNNYGLFFQNELVSVVTFGKSRFKTDEYELYRLCTKKYHSVVGGFEKLIKFSNITSYITYLDRKISSINNNIYINSGMELVGTSPPNYFYINKMGKIHSRYKCQKHKLNKLLDSVNMELTEHENMQINDYHRVYDCGTVKFKQGLLLK